MTNLEHIRTLAEMAFLSGQYPSHFNVFTPRTVNGRRTFEICGAAVWMV